MKRFYSYSILFVGLFFLAASACAKSPPIGPIMNDTPTMTPLPTTFSRISSQIVASSIQELAYNSDFIVIGRVSSKEGFINTARDPNDINKSDSRFYSISQVYKIEIEQIIKGDEVKTLLLVQNQGLITLEPDTTLTLSDIDEEVQKNSQKKFIPLSIDKRYLLFLRVLDEANYKLNVYTATDLYAGVAEPWRFEIRVNETTIPETLLPGVDQYFPTQPLGSIIEAINQPYIPGQFNGPYPPPIDRDLLKGTAYP